MFKVEKKYFIYFILSSYLSSGHQSINKVFNSKVIIYTIFFFLRYELFVTRDLGSQEIYNFSAFSVRYTYLPTNRILHLKRVFKPKSIPVDLVVLLKSSSLYQPREPSVLLKWLTVSRVTLVRLQTHLSSSAFTSDTLGIFKCNVRTHIEAVVVVHNPPKTESCHPILHHTVVSN